MKRGIVAMFYVVVFIMLPLFGCQKDEHHKHAGINMVESKEPVKEYKVQSNGEWVWYYLMTTNGNTYYVTSTQPIRDFSSVGWASTNSTPQAQNLNSQAVAQQPTSEFDADVEMVSGSPASPSQIESAQSGDNGQGDSGGNGDSGGSGDSGGGGDSGGDSGGGDSGGGGE